jgi:hypothetical protein
VDDKSVLRTGSWCSRVGRQFTLSSPLKLKPVGHRPSTDEAECRVLHLRAHGPTPFPFTLRISYPAPEAPNWDRVVRVAEDWLCPA